jgi:hypothetical protein
MPETTDRDAPNWTIAMPGMRNLKSGVDEDGSVLEVIGRRVRAAFNGTVRRLASMIRAATRPRSVPILDRDGFTRVSHVEWEHATEPLTVAAIAHKLLPTAHDLALP